VIVRWLPEAEADLLRQLEYVNEQNPQAAINLSDRIESATDILADHPRSGRLGRRRGTRELIVTRTPYVVIYRVEPSEVVVLRVLHGAQMWPPRGARRGGRHKPQ
jgi:toxin ParE1/3/4